jgi:hypothetical protein
VDVAKAVHLRLCLGNGREEAWAPCSGL